MTRHSVQAVQQVFKRWAAAVMQRYPELDVSTCHNYEISFAFRWQCTNPGCACKSVRQCRALSENAPPNSVHDSYRGAAFSSMPETQGSGSRVMRCFAHLAARTQLSRSLLQTIGSHEYWNSVRDHVSSLLCFEQLWQNLRAAQQLAGRGEEVLWRVSWPAYVPGAV